MPMATPNGMAEAPPPHKPRTRQPDAIGRFLASIKDRKLGTLMDFIDDLDNDMRELAQALLAEGYKPAGGDGGEKPPRRGRRRAAQPDPVILSFEWSPRNDGSVVFWIDGKEFSLPPALADLLCFLHEAAGCWTTDDEIVIWLSKKTGRSYSRKHAAKVVCRLRGELAKAGLEPDLIVFNPRHGRRLAFKPGNAGLGLAGSAGAA